MNEFEKAQILSQDMDRIRQELVMFVRMLIRSVFVFGATFVGFFGIYFGEGIVSEAQKALLFLLLSQVQFVLFLFFCSMLAQIYVHSGYLRALEEKLNELAGENIICWDSKITPKCLNSPRFPFFWTSVVQTIIYITSFILLMYFSLIIANHILWYIGFTMEILISLAFLFWTLLAPKKVEYVAKKELGIGSDKKE